jgi:two-component SAPR family response regulator
MLEILLVDDDPLVRDSLEMLLSHEGFVVECASGGEQALELARQRIFDLVISDVRMPGLDGFDCIQRLREFLPEANFLLITGFSEEDAPVRALRMQVDDFFRKPFDLNLFLERIRVIRRQRAQKRQRNDSFNLETMLELLRKIPGFAQRTDSAVDTAHKVGQSLALDEQELRSMTAAVRLLDLVAELPEQASQEDEEAFSPFERAVQLLYHSKVRPLPSQPVVQLVAALGQGLRAKPLEELELGSDLLQTLKQHQPSGLAESPLEIDYDFRIVSLGATRIWHQGKEIPSSQWESIRSRWVFIYLLSRKGRWVSNEKLRDLFWPEVDADKAQRSLLTAIYRCRKALGDPEVVIRNERGYLLNPERTIWWDIDQIHKLRRQAKAMQESGQSSTSVLEELERLCQGRFAEDCNEDWVEFVRSDVEQCIIECITSLAEQYLETSPELAEQRARRVLRMESTDERAATVLLKALWAQGKRDDTIKFYRDFSSRMERELCLPPSTDLVKLYLQLTQLS